MGGVNLEHLEVVRFYLFGDVKFLHLLLLLMGLDIVTGVAKALKNNNLWSRKSLFGYARKLLILVVIILANVIDQILGMNGAITYATVLFYIANEGLSILENMAELGVLVPTDLAEKLKVIENKDKSFVEEVQEELTGQNIDEELKNNE
ncbi:holin [Pueribacillus theae]|uniref:Holin n=1 Tax=Pueribacillus theae TaxID=2171751 RepID=A0A2U1JK21_9BACI|nr:phage holin family protein [Pueribacillus theae]PWA05492.1 holin [Pueribacillus theae]